ncbi:cubilin-like [Cherax quadricarinatus]|uniref:cubilin-like n=1 Tax=Cherax quadricarinatus TaxID=27406 RepID=UPI00387E8E3B
MTWKSSDPISKFYLRFRSNRRYSAAGFHITICGRKTSCHKLINTPVDGNTGHYQTPKFSTLQNHSSLTQCEWWIVAPPGQTIAVSMSFKIFNTPGCRRDYVIVNDKADKTYSANTSSIYCGTGNKSFISSSNTFYIAYQGERSSAGMIFSYKVQQPSF